MFKALSLRKVTLSVTLLLPLCLTACGKDASQIDGQAREEPRLTGHVLNGSADSPVRIEVFSDLQCPACRELFIRIIKPLMKEYQDKVSIVYYEFPLSGHQYARLAAQYVSAANKLGQKQALSVYDSIFNDQVYWSIDGSLETSVEKALSAEDLRKIRKILQDKASIAEINETIDKEYMLGMHKGINATPTMFISNGGREQKIEGGTPTYQVLKQFLDPLVR